MQPTNWLRLVVYGLAVFRLARLISMEEGPGGLFKHLRQRFDVKTYMVEDSMSVLDQYGQWREVIIAREREAAETMSARFISCPLCVSVWLALPAAVSLWLDWLFGDIVASWLAIASLTVILHRDD